MGSHLQLLIGLKRPINHLHPSEEHRHRWQQLLLEQRDLFLPIGVVNPGPGDQCPLAAWVARIHSTAR
ncbi:MAG: hypothetical protein RLZZ54_1798 [Cyanobacteriota bacterium]